MISSYPGWQKNEKGPGMEGSENTGKYREYRKRDRREETHG